MELCMEMAREPEKQVTWKVAAQPTVSALRLLQEHRRLNLWSWILAQLSLQVHAYKIQLQQHI
jgi:hypothetical protein